MYKKILHATDLNEQHYAQCSKACDLAKYFNAKLYLMHVVEHPMSLQVAQGLGFAQLKTPDIKEAQIILETVGDGLGIPKDQLFTAAGSISEQVIEKSKLLQCDLIIIGAHETESISDFIDNHVKSILAFTECDVLTLGHN